ncbi:hypothetical protein NDA11_002611 [Ustilago hordei]|nr:hypothetical protein NDA11_002611 [Ustilago hordei]
MQGKALALELEETLDDVPEDNQNTGRHNDVPEDDKNTGNRDNNLKEDKDSYLWHERFGHPGRDKTRQIQVHYLGTDERMDHESKHCNACSQGKQTWVQMSQSELKRVEAPLELVHVDLMTDLKGHANYHYALVAVDDFSSLIYVEPLCTKTAAHMVNLTPSATKTIPHEAFYGTTAHKLAQQLRVFGCLAWVHVQRKDQQGKYGARAKPAIMIGYDDEHNAWKFCNLDQPASIQWSNSAMFHEDKGWSDRQQEVVQPMMTAEVEEEGVMPAAVEDLLPAIDNTVGATNTAVLNLDPTLGEAMNAILALAVQNDWEVHALDITMAYLNSRLKEAIYMKPLEGSGVAPRQVYKVVKGLYGLKQSGREWNQEFDRSLRHMGFFQVECAPCIYTKGQGEDMAIVVIYVDDTLVIAPQLETVLKVKKQIGQRWKMEDSVLAKHLDKRTKPTMVPMQSIPEGTLVASAAQQKEYLVIVGKLLWVANSTWPDLSLTGLERQEPKELSLIKGGGAVSKESTPGHEEEEQCQRS